MIFYALFMLVFIGLLIASRSVDHSLVEEDYYASDLAYQEQFNKIQNNINADLLNITHDFESQNIIFDFQHSDISKGEIHFYRPSNQGFDMRKTITGQNMIVPIESLMKGRWKIKVDWTSDGKSFYQEKDIYI